MPVLQDPDFYPLPTVSLGLGLGLQKLRRWLFF